MSGIKGRSGRRRGIRSALHYFNQLYDTNSYELADITIQKALAGDRELLIYCHDRRLGKPKQQTELTGGEHIGEHLGAAMITEIFKVFAKYNALRLKSGALIEQSNTVASPRLESGVSSQETPEDMSFEDIPF